jgi:hypothetical protein
MKTQQIRTKPDKPFGRHSAIRLSGWLQGRDTYLWIGSVDDRPLATISGQRLYRLAKAIVRHYESETR